MLNATTCQGSSCWHHVLQSTCIGQHGRIQVKFIGDAHVIGSSFILAYQNLYIHTCASRNISLVTSYTCDDIYGIPSCFFFFLDLPLYDSVISPLTYHVSFCNNQTDIKLDACVEDTHTTTYHL